MKKFRKVYVEITNICNMHCSFCPETIRTKAFMSVKNFEHIAHEIVPFTDYIYLHVKGEPLLHPDLEKIFLICNKHNLKINISTNATLLKEKYEILKKANIRQLNISLHSFENKEDENSLKTYVENTIEVCNKLAEVGVIIRYKLWNANANTSELKILHILKDEYNIELPSAPYVKDKKLKENIFLSIKQPFKWPDIMAKDESAGSCYGLRNQIAILVDGTVVPCCVDNNGDINLGNILNNSLNEILNNSKSCAIRKGFEDNKCVENLCKKCEYKNTRNINVTQINLT